MRVGALDWAGGVFCGALGALLLIRPDQFDTLRYPVAQLYLVPVGAALLLTGTALLLLRTNSRTPGIAVLAHALAGLELAAVAISMSLEGRWTGAVACASLGAGVAASPFAGRAGGRRFELYGLVLATALAASGVIMLLTVANRFGSDSLLARPLMVSVGLTSLAASGLVIAAELSESVRRPARAVAYALAGVACAVVGFWMQPPWDHWRILFWGGGGILLGVLPWLGNRLGSIDIFSLRVRFALFTAGLTVLVLVTAIALDTSADELVLTDQAIRQQRQVTENVAAQLTEHLAFQRTAVRVVVRHPGFSNLSPLAQHDLLDSAAAAYPDAPSFASFAADGTPLARSGGGPLPAPAAGHLVFEAVREHQATVFDAGPSVLDDGRLSLIIAAPVLARTGELAGVVLQMTDMQHVSSVLRRVAVSADQSVYLLDRSGRQIAPVGAALDPVIVSHAMAGTLGVVRIEGGETGRLVGFAAVGDPDWQAVVDYPLTTALAHVVESRANAFNLMLIMILITASAGAVAAGSLVSPLRKLSVVAEGIVSGTDAPLPHSHISEVAQLSQSFADMRERLEMRSQERGQAEAALRDSNHTLAALVNASPLAVILLDTDGLVTTWNTAAEQLFGWSAAEAQGRPLAALIESGIGTVRASVAEILAGATFSGVEAHRRTRPGEVVDVALWTAPLDAAGRQTGTLLILADMTERARAELERAQRLREAAAREEAEASQQRLSFLAEASSDLSGTLNLQETLQLVARVSVPALAEGCALDLLDDTGEISRVASTVDDSLSDNDTGRVRELLGAAPDVSQGTPTARALREGGPIAQAVASTTAGGDQAWVMAVPLTARQGLLGALTFVSTRAERPYTQVTVALAEALARRCALAIDNARLYAEAQEALRVRDTFLSIASHELRTPLARMKAYTEVLMVAGSQAELDEALLKRSLRSIDRATDRLTAITQDLLDVSRLRGGDLPLRPRRYNLARLVRSVGERYARLASPTHSLLVRLGRAGLAVVIDPDRMEQVLDNLLENALKYSPDGGEIVIEARLESGGVLVQVRDQGIGVPAGAGEAIFEPFGRASNAERRHLPGMGLGLFICRNIVTNHGGRMWVVSAGEQQGTTVNVWLPSDPARKPGPAAKRRLSRAATGHDDVAGDRGM